MGSPASVTGTPGASAEDTGLSILDITKHAAKTAIKLLNPRDRLSIVKFTTEATVLKANLVMTPENAKDALSTIDALDPENSTNIWDGLVKAIDLAKAHPSLPGSVFLLTDGVPNIVPPRGHLPMLSRYIDSNPTLRFTVNTFGFGYNLDSTLLLDLAVAGGGNYAFIPDASFVGTVFVHAVSNELSKLGSSAVLSIECAAGGSGGLVLGASNNKQLKASKTSWGYTVDVGSLSYDQARTFVVAFEGAAPEVQGVTLDYYDYFAGKVIKVTLERALDPVAPATEEIEFEALRLRVVDVVTDLNFQADSPVSSPEVQTLVALLDSKGGKDASKLVHPLAADVSGQIAEAFSKEGFYIKWGRHYLPAVIRAHLLQTCTNFKDPGLQVYGGWLFEKLRTEGDDIFMSMPAPKPSRRGRDGRCRAQMSSSNFSRTYYNASNGCFKGDNTVELPDGSLKKLEDVVKGEVVRGAGGSLVTVVAVVKTLTDGGRCEMVTLPSGTCSTPYHPVNVDGKWSFPKDLAPTVEIDCPAVYSFVVEGGTGVLINGVEGIALGHGIEGDAVASHPYFGTSKIVDDLKKFSTWDSGLVVFDYGCMKRLEHNNTDTLIVGFHDERFLPLGVRTE